MILISGISGFIGTNLAERLQENGYEIIGLTKNTPEFKIKNINIPVFTSSNVNLEKIFTENDIDIVIHLATEYIRSNDYSKQVYETNFKLPCQLAKLAANHHCELFINCESFFQKEPRSGYSHGYVDSKNLFKDFLSEMSDEIQTVSLQLEHVFGQNDNPSKLIPHIINSAINGDKYLNIGFCGVLRDLIYIQDVVDAFVTVIETNKTLLIERYEVGLGKSIYLNEAVKELTKIISNKYPKSRLDYKNISFSKDVNNQILSSCANNKTLRGIGWKPKYSIEDGLNATFDYYLKNIKNK